MEAAGSGKQSMIKDWSAVASTVAWLLAAMAYWLDAGYSWATRIKDDSTRLELDGNGTRLGLDSEGS